MARGIFVTGTDTGIGKTLVASALLRSLVACGGHAIGMKPVAAGIDAGATENADVVELYRAGNVDAPREERNPYAFAAPIAPHIAAANQGVHIDLATIGHAYAGLAGRADFVVVEGAGGALVPLDARFDILDVAATLDLPVLLVVGVRLGCINHACLSALAIRARGLRFAGWVANAVDRQTAEADASVATLRARLAAPLLAAIAFGTRPAFTAAELARVGLAFPTG